MSVGSPRPFAGFTNSDFAYVGLASRRIFLSRKTAVFAARIGKKRLRCLTQQKYESVRRAILAEVKMAYFQLGYLAKQQTTMNGDDSCLQQVETGGGSALSQRNPETSRTS